MREIACKINSLLLIVLLITGVVGCNNVKGLNTEKITIAQDFVPLTDIKPGRKDIYVVVKSMDSSYWQVVLDGTKQAGIDYDCNIYAAGSNLETEWQLQEAYIDYAVENGADAIILGPDDSVQLSAAVDRVHKKGIPIIIVDTIVNTQNYDVCYMTDNLLAGEHAAKEMIRLLKEHGHSDSENITVAIELGARASQTINERLAGFCQYWTKYAPNKWKVIDEIKCNDGDEELAVKLSKDFFDEYPNVDGVFGTDNASSMGFSRAILDSNNKDVVMVGFDYSPEVAEIINAKEYNVSVMVQRQYNMGYCGIESALSILEGNTTELKFIDTGVSILNNDTIESEEIQAIIETNRGK